MDRTFSAAATSCTSSTSTFRCVIGCEVQGFEFHGSELKVSCFGLSLFRGEGLGLRVWGSGSRVEGEGVKMLGVRG
jgi:hypothetical protein